MCSVVNGARAPESAVLRTIRRLLLAIVTLGMAGTGADLLLLGHYEEVWQALPLLPIAMAFLAIAWLLLARSVLAVTAMRIVMLLFIATGVGGMLLHYNGNREFQREIDPDLRGWSLFMTVITSNAPPALAPSVMIHLGVLGLLYTYRHPALDGAVSRPHSQSQEPL